VLCVERLAVPRAILVQAPFFCTANMPPPAPILPLHEGTGLLMAPNCLSYLVLVIETLSPHPRGCSFGRGGSYLEPDSRGRNIPEWRHAPPPPRGGSAGMGACACACKGACACACVWYSSTHARTSFGELRSCAQRRPLALPPLLRFPFPVFLLFDRGLCFDGVGFALALGFGG
jgi:hypothetical protein